MNVSVKASTVFFLLILSSFISPSHAKRMPPSSHLTTDLIQKFETDHQKREIAVLAKELFSVEKVYFYGQVSFQDLTDQISNDLGKIQKWTVKLSTNQMDILRKHKSDLQKVFEEKSIVWSWVQYHLNDKGKSKFILSALFEEQYKKTIALKVLRFRFGESPMLKLESLFEILRIMTSEKEISYFKGKVQEAKKHISNLPDLHPLT